MGDGKDKPVGGNPFADWDNDDILVPERVRVALAQASPRAFRVLDWPALRQEFLKHDAPAGMAKEDLNSLGLTAIRLSATGASLIAVAPILAFMAYPIVTNMAVLLGCALVATGFGMGTWHLFGHSGRARWLLERLMTERLRQFYFQHLINNLGDAVAAMDDDGKLQEYTRQRDGALVTFIDELVRTIASTSPKDAIAGFADDDHDTRVWGNAMWTTDHLDPGTAMTAATRELFGCLSHSRIFVQADYAARNLDPKKASQGRRATAALRKGNAATIAFVASLTGAGVAIGWGHRPESLLPTMLIAASGVAAAWGLYFRLANQGMGYTLDAERNKLYGDQIALVRQRFDAAGDDVRQKVEALRLMEMYSYREMRQFLRTHLRSQVLG